MWGQLNETVHKGGAKHTGFFSIFFFTFAEKQSVMGRVTI